MHTETALMTPNDDGEDEVGGRPDSALTLHGKADIPPPYNLRVEGKLMCTGTEISSWCSQYLQFRLVIGLSIYPSTLPSKWQIKYP